MKKFTFKTHKPTGRYRAFGQEAHHIKYNKIEVGIIREVDATAEKSAYFKIGLQVMKTAEITDKNPNCPWRWIHFKAEFQSLDAAKVWLNENVRTITSQFTLVTE
jgi:hypothetical protein